MAGDEGYKQNAAVLASLEPGFGRTRVEANHFQKKIKKI
jgi:hypothetical protein